MLNFHESFSFYEYAYIEEKFGKIERELSAIIAQFRAYVESGDQCHLDWAWQGIDWLANREGNVAREWDYIRERHDEAINKTRLAPLGAENVEVR